MDFTSVFRSTGAGFNPLNNNLYESHGFGGSNMIFADLRYVLPGSAPRVEK